MACFFWKRRTDSLSFPALLAKKDSPLIPCWPSKLMISSDEDKKKEINCCHPKRDSSLNHSSQLTWVVLSNGDEVKEPFTGEQLCDQGQKSVRHLSSSPPSGPGSLYTRAANLEENRTMFKKPLVSGPNVSCRRAELPPLKG